MNAIEINPEDLLSAERKIPSGTQIVMLNLVAYRESVEYPGMERCSGREAYLTRYAPAFNKAAAAAGVNGIEVVYLGAVAACIVPSQKCQWDEVVLVRYPSFSALRKEIDGITQRMLTLTLRNLERDGMVMRHYFPEVPPRVEYELTDMGAGVLRALESFNLWVRDNLPVVEEHRRSYDEALK